MRKEMTAGTGDHDSTPSPFLSLSFLESGYGVFLAPLRPLLITLVALPPDQRPDASPPHRFLPQLPSSCFAAFGTTRFAHRFRK